MMSNPETPNNIIEEQAEEEPKKATRGRPRKQPKEEQINPEPKKETRGRPKKTGGEKSSTSKQAEREPITQRTKTKTRQYF